MMAPLCAFVVCVGGCASSGYHSSARATHVSASAGYYYDDLDPYGTWVHVASYGHVWCPLDVSAGWRPYTVGYWAYTDWGWMWMPEDPWGWTPYRYGRWTHDAFYGWVWVPGDVWGPAWVSLRYGSGWVGWAPLPPDVGWRAGIGLQYSSREIDPRIHSYSWCFVPVRDFANLRIRGRVAPPSRNVTLLPRTRNVTEYQVIDSRPVVRGLRPEIIEREAGRKIPRYRIVETKTPRGKRDVEVRGQVVEVYRPAPTADGRASERMRPPPPERVTSRPPRALLERQDAERRRFEDRTASERARLKREQDQELRNPSRSTSKETLRRRHEAEMRAQQEVEQRERKVLEERSKRLKNRAEEPDTPEKERGQGRGRDRGRSKQYDWE
jgi:hypothetical protein